MKKLLNLTLILMTLIGIKIPIIININEKKPDKNIEKIQVFLTKINNQKFEEAIELLDIETINKYKKIELPKNEYINALDNRVNRNFIKYNTNKIQKKKDKNTLYGIILKKILKKDDMNYEIYIVEGEIPDYNIRTKTLQRKKVSDVVYINPENYKIYGSYILNNMFESYYYTIN